MSAMPSAAFAGFLGVAALVAGCSVSVEVEPERVPPLPPGVAPPTEGCSVPLPVLTGKAWVGAFYLYADGAIEPVTCDPAQNRAVRLVVPAFYLDADTVTNDCYAHCVDEGPCEAPAPLATPPPDAPQPWNALAFAEYPAFTSLPQAQAFCAWRGGRLASWAELTRAEQGEDAAPGRPSAVSAWIACAVQDFKSAACAPLIESPFPFAPTRDDPEDMGPFGHTDLFTMELTWMATRGGNTCDPYLPDDSVDPVSFGPEGPLAFAPRALLYTYLAPPAILFPKKISSSAAFTEPQYRTVIRCAYDPASP